MSKIKIEEIALEVGASDKDVLAKAKELGYKVRAKNSTLDENEAMILVDYVMYGKVPDSMKKDLKIEKATKSDTDDKSIKKSTVCKNKEVAQESSLVEDKEETTPKQPKKRSGIQMTPKIIEKVEEKPEVEVNVTEESSSTAEEKPAEEKPKIEPKKRRGITIVKKKNPVVEKKKVVNSKPSSIAVVKKSTKKKKVPVSAKESGEKLDIMSDRGLGGGSEVYEDQEVMMLDFSDKTILEDAQREEEQRREAARKRAIKGGQKSFVNNNFNNKPAGRRKKKKRDYKKVKDQEEKKIDIVKIPEDVRVYEFAEKIGKSVGEIITVLFTLGTIVTKNDFLDKDSIEILADEFEVEVETINPLDELDYVAQYDEEEDKDAVERAPVITIMGHVDHGKTSLLDKIREAKVADKEAGGITQHVGAYQVEKSGKKITFIDTPGHSAFTEMRARGARSTDIAIIVVAADDGVMPQTRESISHAQAADVPIIVAVNKIDKPTANIDNVKSQLAELGITPVDWGGEHEFMPVSAHTGEGIDDLLETILLQAEIMELKADPSRYAKAIVIESLVEKGLGSVANIIVQNGSLSVGDNVIVGTTFGKVRTLILDDGSRVKKIGPSTPAALIGLDELPNAGDLLVAMDNAKDTVELAKKRKDLARAKELSKSTKVSFDELSDLIAEGKIKKLPLIIKADVQGSLEAIKKALEELKNDEVEVQVIHSGVGAISESDVILADASEHSLIAGFNVRPTGAVKSKAKEIGVEIKTYSVIYEIVDDVKALLGGLMSPVESEETLGQAEVRQTFAVAKVGTIAGCFVIDGKIERNSNARLIRDGVVIYTTQLSSLKRFNDDVKEVGKGYECGIMLENYNDLKEGDIIEIFKTVQEQVTL